VTTGYAIWWFIRPSHVLVFMLVLGVLLLLRGRARAARILLVGSVAGVLVGGFLPLGSCLLAPLEDRFPEPELPAEVHGIIVLAGGEQPAQTARHATPHFNGASERLLAGLALAQRYPAARLVHSGGRPAFEDGDTGEVTMASDVARALALALGLDERRLLLERGSSNTCESAREVARLVAPPPGEVWLLVTSAFHMPRSIACFRAAGLQVVAVPVDYRQGVGGLESLSAGVANNLDRLDLAMHEWLGLVVYRVRGRTNELFPAP
jgi:uncharacterized SAM-binding protein YcdF (DUF218 family)